MIRKKKPLENTLGKEEMPVTSIFIFSKNVYNPSKNKDITRAPHAGANARKKYR